MSYKVVRPVQLQHNPTLLTHSGILPTEEETVDASSVVIDHGCLILYGMKHPEPRLVMKAFAPGQWWSVEEV